MKLIATLRTVCAAGLIMAVAAGCSSSSADGPRSSVKTSASLTPSVLDPDLGSAGNTTSGSSNSNWAAPSVSTLASQEAADRASVEQTWADFWKISANLWQIPEQDRLAQISPVAVDPSLSESLQQAENFASGGIETFGIPTFHPYWEESINGSNLAVMGDCMDTSMTGSIYSSTGQTRSAGVSGNNTRGTFVRGTDGQWRVQKIVYLLDISC